MNCIFKDRIAQHARQKEVDTQLKELPCTRIVSEYLLSQREKNREMTKEYCDAKIYNVVSVAKQQLVETEKDLKEVEDIVKNINACWKLGNKVFSSAVTDDASNNAT